MLHKHRFNLYQLRHIETPRLLIRPVQLGDEFGLHETIMHSVNELRHWMPWARDTRFQATHDFIHRNVRHWHAQTSRDFPLTVIHKASGKIISASGYNEHTDFVRPCFEIGYWIDSSFAGKGLASEIVNALTRYALEAIQAIRVQVCTQVGNHKSSLLAKRLGYVYEGIIKNICLDCITHLPDHGLLFSCTSAKQLPPLDVKWQHDLSIKINKNNKALINLSSEGADNVEKLPTLQSSNICLRAPKTQESEKLYHALVTNQDELRQQFSWANHHIDLENVQYHIQKSILAANDILAAEKLFFLVWDKYFEKILGEVWCTVVDWAVPHISLHAWFDMQKVDQAIAHDALYCFIRFIFSKRNAKCITFYISEKNKFLVNTARNLGFQYEGTLKNYCRNFVTNEISAAKLFSMTEFSQLKKIHQ